MTSRLTQIATPGRAYKQPTDVDLQSKRWGWSAYSVTVAYEKPPTSRLGQSAVPAVAYSREEASIIGLSSETWGWTAYPITVDYQDPQDVDLRSANWGWTSQSPKICSQDNRGYYGSFNPHVWPSCVFNDYVFGPRTHALFEVGGKSWGWTAYPITVEFLDPVDVVLDRANWGYTVYPMGISFGSEVGLTAGAWGWTEQPVAVEMPYDVGLFQADWGWQARALGVTYGSDVGLSFSTWGWMSYPVTVDAPTFDIQLPKTDWGWQGFPTTVKQTSLLPGDIEAIADAVYQKFLDEGVLDQLVWVFRRAAGDPNYPQIFHTREDGHGIEVGPHTIAQTTDSKGNVTQTRQS